MSRLLIVYHSKNGHTAALTEAVVAGSRHPEIDVEVRIRLAREAVADDVLWCDAIVLGTPENFGYMSGGLKDFFDRTYYPLEGRVEGLPYAVFISAGNDGEGALTSIRRIVRGYPFREVHDPVICRGEPDPNMLEACEALGTFMAAGVEARLF